MEQWFPYDYATTHIIALVFIFILTFIPFYQSIISYAYNQRGRLILLKTILAAPQL